MSQPSTGALEINSIIVDSDAIATTISNQFVEWEALRSGWLAERRELMEYIFATSTMGTSTSTLAWKNSTHIPKICQLRDNLLANYEAALFPTDNPYSWEGNDETSSLKEKREIIESYMANKLKLGGYRKEVLRMLLDFIDYGNCYATVDSIYQEKEDPVTLQKVPGFIGPKAVRIAPTDIVFNPAAKDFEHSAKIIRSMKTLGSLKREIEEKPEMAYMSEVFDKMMNNRNTFRGYSEGDFVKDTQFEMAGFSSWYNYFMSDAVEVLDFYGDVYNPDTQELETNRVITVVDRHYVLRNEANPSWADSAPIFHAGWRIRPDNLIAMGPLDNLVGLQYRIDHLENAKADGFDLIVHPVIKVKGFVEDFNYGPNEKVYVGDDGDIEFMSPDVTMLAADTQIAMYEQKMEEFAGAPKQAMGFRTPGEKTKYEVQVLENGANKVFLSKASYFEEMFLEKLLNAMLMSARQNLTTSDVIRVSDDDTGAVEFLNITPEDLTASGKIYPVGARHYARDANMLQSLTQLAASPLLADPSVKNHFSGERTAKLLERLLGVTKHGLVQKNIGIAENVEAQQTIAAAQQMLAQQNSTPMRPEEGEPQGPQEGAPIEQ